MYFFWVGNFDARYFLGSKISGLCIFLGLQYEAPSDRPVMYTSSTPLGDDGGLHIFFQNFCRTKPCMNNGKCLLGYTDKKYVCVCQAGYTGENCEKGNTV